MDYISEKKPFAKTIKGVSMDKYILMTENTAIKVTDYKLKVVALRTYCTKVIQSEIVERRGETYVIVLLETCRFEIMKFDGIRLILIGLKYFEHSKFFITEVKLLNSLDIDTTEVLYKNTPLFMHFDDFVLVRISNQFVALFNFTQEDQSQIFDVTNDLRIKNIIKFTPVTNFTLPSVLFLCDYHDTKHAFVFSYDGKFYKIADFEVGNDVCSVETLRNGICFVYKNSSQGLLLTTIKNSSNITKIEVPDKINDVKTFEDIAFVFCECSVYAIDINFMHDRVKSYNVTKIICANSQYGCVTASHIFVGNTDDNCYLHKYRVESVDKEEEEAIPQEIVANEIEEIPIIPVTQETHGTADLFDDIYAPIQIDTKDNDKIDQPAIEDQFAMYKDLYSESVATKNSNPKTNKEFKVVLGECETIENYNVAQLCKLSATEYIGISKSKAILFSDSIEILLLKTFKLKGFDCVYSAKDLYCMSNSRESIFCKWDSEIIAIEDHNFVTEESTLLFTEVNNGLLQITESKIILDSLSFCDGSFVEAKIAKYIAYILTSNNELLKFDGSEIKACHSSCELFAVTDNYLVIVSHDHIVLFDGVIEICKQGLSKIPCISGNGYANITDILEVEIIHEDTLYVLLRSCNSLHTLAYNFEIKTLLCIHKHRQKFDQLKKNMYVADKCIILVPDTLIYFYRHSLYIHKINSKIDYVYNNLAMIKGHLVEYTINSDYNLANYKPSKKFEIGDLAFMIDYSTETDSITIIKKISAIKEERTYDIHALCLYTKVLKLIDTFEFEEFEYVTDIKYMHINENVKTDLLPRSNYNLFLIVTLSVLKGHEELSKGRIIVFEIKTIIGQAENKIYKKINPLADLKLSSNIVSCQEVRGNIAVCQGTRLMIYKFDRLDGLTAIAFYDMQILCTSISTAKNYILVGDILRGASFFYLQHKPVKIHKLSTSECIRNLQHVSLQKIGTDKPELLLLAFDEDHIHIYTYSPNNVLSKNGEYLIKRNVTNIKQRILGMIDGYYYSSDTLYAIRKNDIDEAVLRIATKKNRNVCAISRQPLSMVTVKPIVDFEEFCGTEIDL